MVLQSHENSSARSWGNRNCDLIDVTHEGLEQSNFLPFTRLPQNKQNISKITIIDDIVQLDTSSMIQSIALVYLELKLENIRILTKRIIQFKL